MKNYPLLTINNVSLFRNWTKTILVPLLEQIKALSYYSYFIIPPYRLIDNADEGYREIYAFLKDINFYYYNSGYQSLDIINQEDFLRKREQYQHIYTNSSDVVIEYTGTDYNELPVHAYYQITEPITIDNIELPAGSYIVSEARAENAIDDSLNDIRANFKKYYTFLPGGSGSFYVLANITTNPLKNDEMTVTFNYNRNAGDIYGYNWPFNFILSSNRFVLKVQTPIQENGVTVGSNTLGTLIGSFPDWQFIEWYTLGRPMHFNHTDSWEEIIYDETSKIKIAEENFHYYTINIKNSNKIVSYIDFI